MPKLNRLPLALIAGVSLTLGACSGGGDDGNQGPPVTQEFQRLVEDANYEMGEGNLAEAGRLFDEALTIDRENPGLWVDIAKLRFRGGEHLGAVEAADHALQLDPQFAPALLFRAQLVRDAYGLQAALTWFESGLAVHPEDRDLLAEYAATLGDLGRHKDMLKAVRQLADEDPRDPRVHFLQAVLAVRANDPVLASSLLKRSGMRDRGVPAAIIVEAVGEMQQGNFDNAATSLEDLLARQPGNVRAMELLARAMWLNGRDREIVDRFGARAGSVEASPYLVMLVGRSYERLGNRARAAELIDRARAGRTGQLIALGVWPEMRMGLPEPTRTIREMIGSGNASATRSYAGDIVSRFPGSSDVLALAGDAAMARGDTGAGLDLYSRAAEIRRPWPLTRKIILAYRALGDSDAADALLVRQVQSEPINTEALIMYAERSAQDEDWLRVAVLLDTAIKLGAGNDPKLLGLRANAANALGEDQSEFVASYRLIRPAAFISE